MSATKPGPMPARRPTPGAHAVIPQVSTLPAPRAAVPAPPGPEHAPRLAAALARWYVEAVAGRRDAAQLRDLLSPEAEDAVRRTAADRRRAGSAARMSTARIRGVRVAWPAPDTCEALVLLEVGSRTTALCATLHRFPRGWSVSAIGTPEDDGGHRR